MEAQLYSCIDLLINFKMILRVADMKRMKKYYQHNSKIQKCPCSVPFLQQGSSLIIMN